MELINFKRSTRAQNNELLSKAEHPVVMFANGYGDHYLNLPTLRAFANIFDGKLTLVGTQGAIGQVSGDLNLRKLVELPMQYSKTGRKFDVERASREIGACDFFISLNPWINDEVKQLLATLNPTHSLGFFEDFDHYIPRVYDKHSVDLSFDCVQRLEASWRPSMFSAPPRYPQIDIDTAASIWSALSTNRKVLALHVDTLPEKMWPNESWQSLINQFLDTHKDYSIITIGINGIETSELKYADRVLPACGLSIPVSALLLSRCQAFIGVDSVFLHIADLYRVPAIGLFGPTDPLEWGIRFGPGENISQSTMSDITVTQVLDSLESLIATPKQLKSQIV